MGFRVLFLHKSWYSKKTADAARIIKAVEESAEAGNARAAGKDRVIITYVHGPHVPALFTDIW